MANKRSFLKAGEYLGVGEYLVSTNKKFYLILQSDGNLCTYKGSGPDPNLNQECLWASGKTESGGQFFAIQQVDGNFCVYKGTGPRDNRGILWPTGVFTSEGKFFAIQQGDGSFCVYKGEEPNDNQGFLWGSGKTALVGTITVISGDGDNFVPQSYRVSQGNTITFQAGGNSKIQFYAWRYKEDGTIERAFTSGDWPYTAPPASDAQPASFTLKDNIRDAKVTLSLSPPTPKGKGKGEPMNGTINVSGGPR